MSIIRKLASVTAAVACAAGLSLASAPAASAAVVPVHGSYDGVDHHGRAVSFSFNGTTVNHFMVGSLHIGTAHVSNGMWHETCGGGYCFKGQWITDGIVHGYWRYGGSHEWTPWSADGTRVLPYGGSYRGRDHTSLGIHFTYSNGYLRGFTWDSNHIGDAYVHPDGSFSVCHRNLCFKGHWQSSYYVVGEWRHADDPHTWHTWDANAYAP